MYKNYETDEHNTYHDNDMKCPKCGRAVEDSWEYSEDEGEAYCGYCEADFEYISETTRKFSTYCKKHDLVTDVNKEPEQISGKPHRYYECRTCCFTKWMEEKEAKECSSSIVEDKNWRA